MRSVGQSGHDSIETGTKDFENNTEVFGKHMDSCIHMNQFSPPSRCWSTYSDNPGHTPLLSVQVPLITTHSG